MALMPQLNVICGRCGKRREGIRHDCRSNSTRSATLKPQLSFGTCPKCKKPQGNPLTHVCAPKSDFKQRRSRAAKAEREAARKKKDFKTADAIRKHLAGAGVILEDGKDGVKWKYA